MRLIAIIFTITIIISQGIIAQGYTEKNGLVAVQAEHFSSQVQDEKRRWYVIKKGETAPYIQDRDGNHAASASGESYVEILPDTRATHSDRLISGVNFSNTPGEMAILSYNVYFETPGDYIVWVRAYSTGGEDNGIHVGIDGTWPHSGQRIQFCPGKHKWTWSSAQRVPHNHCGTPRTVMLTVPTAGIHTIHFSMREDGFEFDKFIMAYDNDYQPEELGPKSTFSESVIYSQLNQMSKNTYNPIRLSATTDFPNREIDGYVPYYIDKDRNALGINAAKEEYRGKFAAAEHKFEGEKGVYSFTLFTMQETDGESEYIVSVNGKEVLSTQNQPTQDDYSIHEGHAAVDVMLNHGDVIQVSSNAITNGLIPEANTTAYARGRWVELLLLKNEDPIMPQSGH